VAKPSREYIHGINPCFEVIRAGRRKLYEAFISETLEKNSRLKKLVRYLEDQKVPVSLVGKQRLFELAKSKEHQGAVLKTSVYPYTDLNRALEAPRLLLLDNVEDPHNVGAILRCAEIFGFTDVLLPMKGVPDVYPSVVKVSAGASEHLRIVKSASANFYTRHALAAGFTVIALDAKGTCDIEDFQHAPPERPLLVVGGEAAAVGQFILNAAHHVASIRQHGKVNSLNASVAAGIAMFVLAPGERGAAS
jgi:23S rRNA (guanosine2251-2'-O)-methyltransferase